MGPTLEIFLTYERYLSLCDIQPVLPCCLLRKWLSCVPAALPWFPHLNQWPQSWQSVLGVCWARPAGRWCGSVPSRQAFSVLPSFYPHDGSWAQRNSYGARGVVWASTHASEDESHSWEQTSGWWATKRLPLLQWDGCLSLSDTSLKTLLLVTYRTLAYVSSSSATIQAMSAKVGTIGPSMGRRGANPGNS